MLHSELAVPILLLDKGQEPENSGLTIQHTKNIYIPSHSINADKETVTVIMVIKWQQ